VGKASSSKKIARVARAGGGRARRQGGLSLQWIIAVVVFCGVGVFLVLFSRNQNITAAEGPRPRLVSSHPQDHWHVAYGIYICDKFLPSLAQNTNLGTATSPGIHTHGDGLIHVEAQNDTETGRHATVGKFFQEYPGAKLTSTSITIPGLKTYKNGQKCGKKSATLQAWEWDSPKDTKGKKVIGNPADVLLKEEHIVTIGFVPNGTTLPKPSSVANLKGADQRESPPTSSTTTTTAAPGATTTTTANKNTTTTTAASGTTTTTKKP
jgi:hypothetical protein